MSTNLSPEEKKNEARLKAKEEKKKLKEEKQRKDYEERQKEDNRPKKGDIIHQEAKEKPLKNPGIFLLEYVLGKYLGEGAHSRVFLCEHKLTVQRYAVKILEKKLLRSGMRARYMREITMVHKLSNCFIVHIFEYFEDGERIYIIMEYCAGGSLF